MTIQWFPGHMAKARRQVTEKLKLVDIIFELVDARIPMSSRNPMIDDIINQKPRLILINKADMADPNRTKQWISYFENKGIKALAINSEKGTGLQQIQKATMEILHDKWERMRSRGMRPRAVRAMIVGIPNVGKSTLINRLVKKNIAQTGNRPGVTKAQQWIKVGKEMELLDTPGILWPKFEDPEVGYRLALTGAIKDTLLNLQDISIYSLNFLTRYYPERLKNRYEMEEIPEEIEQLFEVIGKRRGCLMAGGIVDYDKTAEVIIRDVRNVQLGPITFDLEVLEEVKESAD
ncbi:ribosome biogenesis GTPase YlqF [Jeotgalibacillus proteolyticus]|uniref:Ribosome biogenesis GTPase A n=1 Tax=Jeotgalibacillus proteolyticus TaxID=2082395 RepID=A0A2S5GGA9_9BACL|nr:ribosome biogenesis GTPase YlqF [Jeotgalibacillus proteolyticus]PPA72072.1 ribosome biogenesis GTPase YlqF [Jeotgalibacillus proteolyticus]